MTDTGQSLSAVSQARLRLPVSRPVDLLLAVAVFAVCGVLAITALVVFELRAREIANTKRELARLNVSLTEQTARSFQSVDLILSSIVDQLRSEGIDSAQAYARRMAGPAVHELLRAKISGVPQLDAVTMIGADGHLINFSRYYPIPPVNVSDRDYFRALKNNPTRRSFLSVPVRNRGTGTWTIYLARRVSDPQGGFIGLVLGAINLDYFETLYRALEIDAGGSISMWRRDGTLLARYPPLPSVGHTFTTIPFKEVLAHSDASAFEVDSSIDGHGRLIATRAVHDYPIVVSVTRTMHEVLADWRREAAVISAAGLICALALALAFWMLLRLFRSYEILSRAVAQREEAIRAREEAEAQVSHLVKMEALGQLTGGIAHDFNNLLTIILGNLELLRSRLPEDDGTLARLVDTAMHGAERGATMTHRLLAFSRRQPLAPEPLDANRLIAGMSDLWQRTLGEAVRVETRLAAGLWGIFVDGNQLESALLNLAVNARDAMPNGGRLTIETANTVLDAKTDGLPSGQITPGEYVMVAVSDTGVGMPPEIINRAFEPFFTTKEPGRGTGLGLSQVYGFITQSGGHIRILSGPGAGTAVRLYLPRHTAIAEDAAGRTEFSTTPISGHQETILVVEDEEDVRSYSAEVLRELGYRVVEAQDGAQALRLIDQGEDIHLLFTDIGLPGGLNGFELVRQARRRRPDLVVLLATGYARGTIGEQDLGGAWELLYKPFTTAGLAGKIREMLERRRAPA